MSLSHKTQDKRQHKQCTHISSTIFNTILTDKISTKTPPSLSLSLSLSLRYNPALNHTAGEFGHNDFYGVAVAACQMTGRSGADALLAMACIDEIRGRLAEVFSLKSYKVDHVVHGAIASAAVYGTLMGATAEQIEMAIGMVVAHHIPFRAIRAGKQLSDSKGSSAAISTEAAMQCVHRTMDGFLGPRDIFRNPEAIFRLFEGPGQMLQKVDGPVNREKADASPFDLHLSNSVRDYNNNNNNNKRLERW